MLVVADPDQALVPLESPLNRSSPRKKRTRHNTEITVRDVAERAQVSEMTVSRVIRKKGYVAQKTRELVLQAASELGYVPNQIAGALASRSTNLIAIVVPTLTNQVYAEVLAGIHEELRGTAYQPVFGISDYDRNREETLIRDMLAWRPGGLVVSGNNQTADARRMIRNAAIPFVQIMEHIKRPLQFSVGIAHREVGEQVATHLLSRGYRSLGYIGNNIEQDTTAQQRFEGFAGFVEQAGVQLQVLTVPDLVSSSSLGRDLTDRLMHEHAELDAIHYANDTLAIGGMMHCLSNNLRVPEDIALCGYVGLDMAECLPITLTTVRVPRRQIGQTAGQYLTEQLEADQEFKRHSVKMPFELVPGDST